MIVAYTRSVVGNQRSCEIQRRMISRYVKEKRIRCDQYFEDLRPIERNRESVCKMHEIGFMEAYRREKYFPQWEEMLRLMLRGHVKIVLVDSAIRLFTNRRQKLFFDQVCEKFRILIVEVGDKVEEIRKNERKSVVLYLFTNQSDKRPVVVEKEIDRLYDVASHQEGWDAPFLFLDYSLRKSMHTKYRYFREQVEDFDILLVKSFYHIEDKTVTFMKEALELIEKYGIEIISIEEGKLHICKAKDKFQEKLNIASYDRWIENKEERQLQSDIFETFVKCRTNWKSKDMYIERKKVEQDAEQLELLKLIEHKEDYDLILVKSFNRFHWRTSMFSKKVRELGLPIYSLMEGVVYYADPNI